MLFFILYFSYLSTVKDGNLKYPDTIALTFDEEHRQVSRHEFPLTPLIGLFTLSMRNTDISSWENSLDSESTLFSTLFVNTYY